MFKNYWITAVRSLQRNRSYTIINFLGLTVGMAACLLLFLLVRYETSFDAFHTKKDRIYRVTTVNRGPQGEGRQSGVPYALAGALKSAGYAQLEQVAASYMESDETMMVEREEGKAPKVFKENFFYAGAAFFKIFDFGALDGDPKVLLDAPYNAMLTKSTAEKYFGDWKSAIGKTLQIHDKVLVKVAGILQDPPANTDFPFTVVIAHSTLAAANIIGIHQPGYGTGH